MKEVLRSVLPDGPCILWRHRIVGVTVATGWQRSMGVVELSADRQRLVRLMTGYQNGNMEDFNDLYAALEGPLKRYLWTFVHDVVTVEDVLQTTFLQLHRARHTYIPPRPVKPWVYAIARHVALMHLRSHRRHKEVPPTEALPDIPIPPEVEKLGNRRLVQRLLLELPRAAQEVLVLHHMLGLSFAEIGRVMGISPGAAKVRAHRALKTLRIRVGELGGRT